MSLKCTCPGCELARKEWQENCARSRKEILDFNPHLESYETWMMRYAFGTGKQPLSVARRLHPITTRIDMALTGWTSTYYQLPEGAKEIQDLIECKNMSFAVGNIFKAAYRLGAKEGTTEVYDLDKIIWYAQREKARIEKEEKNESIPSGGYDTP